jgi:hypothetical protein
MAYLIERSGEGALVSRLARTRNQAYVRDLAGDPALAAWLNRNGLTLDEAARIQPEYSGTVDEKGPRPGAWAASTIGAAVGLTGVGLNVSIGASRNARNARGLLGVVCGVFGAGLGASGLSEDGAVPLLGAIDIGAGLASFGLGLRQLNATGERRPQAAAREIVPEVWRDGGGTRRLALVMRF